MTKKRAKSAGTAKATARKKAGRNGVPRPAKGAATPTPSVVKVKAAKGRPMLVWVGKRPLSQVTAFPAQHIETFDPTGSLERPPSHPDLWQDWPSGYPKGGLLFHGDNKEALAHLLANGFRGKVNLIYIDPPFDSGADYVRSVTLRGLGGTAKIDGEEYTLGEQIQYTDIWANDNYLQFMYERVLLLRELLAADGSMYLHCDWNRSHVLRCVVEEVFGAESVRNEIVWKRTSARADSTTLNHIHDVLFLIVRGEAFRWNQLFTSYDEDYVRRVFSKVEEGTNRRFKDSDLTARGLRTGASGRPWRGFNPAAQGNHWLTTVERLDKLDSEGKIYWSKDGGWPRLKHYLDEAPGVPLQSIWTDIFAVNSQAEERIGFPTQKPEALLHRILEVSSRHGDVVLDCFVGSGTTAAVAQKLGRRWIGCDINKGAIQTTAKRLQGIINEQISAEQAKVEAGTQATLPDMEGRAEDGPALAQLGFTVWRVNDYDLNIQHNEAVNLACEHIGVVRTRTDAFFDGTLGRSLVKIVPFDHPLSPLDLEELKRELDARPDEDRSVTMVCLGLELAARAWIEDWNRLRKGKNAVNRLELIELRSDPKYGRFIRHQPADAKVAIVRKKDRVVVEIQEFVSPSIIERLQQQAGVLKPHIDDWRAMVDCVMIDTSYNGKIFDVVLSDIPERKTDFVQGRYELAAPQGETTVAVKIIDMLGEEVLVTQSM